MAHAPTKKHALLFDGRCNFCGQQLHRLLRLARPGTIEPVDFQAAGALDRFPGLTHEACMEAMHLVTPDGKIFRGFEAAVHAIATRPILGKLAYLYYLPGLRGICDRNAAQRLTHVKLFVPRERLPAPAADEFYHVDLIGLRAVTVEGDEIGTVLAVHDFGAGDIIEVRLAGSGATVMLPFSETFVPGIDIAGRCIVIAAPAEPANDGSDE